MAGHQAIPQSLGNHFTCSMTAVLLGEVMDFGGEEAVADLLRRAGSSRSPEYLTDITNWVSYEEANALWEAGTYLTHRPSFSRQVGEVAARRLKGSPVAALLRSLGSPEAVYRQMSVTAAKFTTVAELRAVDTGPGHAEVTARAVEGFQRSRYHCDWTVGLLSCATELFGLAPAVVEHPACQGFGAPQCVYQITWDAGQEQEWTESSEQLSALSQQLEAMRERLHSMFATASDLIASDEVEDVLARITDRAALEVRAPRYLLAVRLEEDGELRCHHRGFDEQEAASYAELLLDRHTTELPDSWLVVPVASDRRDYGRLMAAFESRGAFFPQERELFEVYARYAASALDGAAALLEAQQRYDESSALLRLARALASAGTSEEVAQRLADAVPLVVDCDRVSVYLWDPARDELVRRALATRDPDDPLHQLAQSYTPSRGGPVERLLRNPDAEPQPVFVDAQHGDPRYREQVELLGDAAAILVPICTPDSFLGLLGASVRDRPERLRPNPDLLNRITGVAAQAKTALQNGRLLDQITHQATHDQLTGLANRLRFTDELRKAVNSARRESKLVTVFYLDLDGFKPVNDEFGHEVGDRLLAVIAQRLLACTRSADTRSPDVVARLGGDEFAVLITDAASASEADLVADRLTRAFAEPFCLDGLELRVRASIGRASFPLDADSADALLRQADAAMFAVKPRVASGHRALVN
jgi:diguanylate cyclase (GGDEF)-like protein